MSFTVRLYSVEGRSGEKTRHSEQRIYCRFAGADTSSVATAVELKTDMQSMSQQEELMGNRRHAHVLNIEGGEVERISDPSGKSYFCRTCGSDRCRHVKRMKETDALHLAQSERRADFRS